MTDFRPRGGVTPYLNVDGARKALDFYKIAFGGVEREVIPSEGSDKLMHSQIDINGSPVFVCDFFPDYGFPPVPAQGFNMHIHVDDAQCGGTAPWPLAARSPHRSRPSSGAISMAR